MATAILMPSTSARRSSTWLDTIQVVQHLRISPQSSFIDRKGCAAMMCGNVILRKVRKLVRSERGGAVAELAIMAPFLALMLAVVCEVGRYFDNYTTLAKGT